MDPNDEALSEPFIEEEVPPRPAPVMDVVPPPSPSASGHTSNETKSDASHPLPPKSVTLKEPGTSVTIAVVATVIIVVSLAGLAVFAYLKTQK